MPNCLYNRLWLGECIQAVLKNKGVPSAQRRQPGRGCARRIGVSKMTYSMTVAGLQRELPICKVADDLYIGAFICFGDAELTVACARDLLKLVEN